MLEGLLWHCLISWGAVMRPLLRVENHLGLLGWWWRPLLLLLGLLLRLRRAARTLCDLTELPIERIETVELRGGRYCVGIIFAGISSTIRAADVLILIC